MNSNTSHNSSFALQKYMLLQEQHEELCLHLDQIRQPQFGGSTIYASPTSSPTRSNASLSSSSSPPPAPRRHSRRHHRSSAARCSGWGEERTNLDTIVDEETVHEISVEEQRLFDVNESIKRALTELLNCAAVRGDGAFRMWVQSRLMETEKELRVGRRRRSSGSTE